MEKKKFSFRMSDGNVVLMEAYDTLPSTAALAKQYAEAGYPDRYVVFADRQTETPITGTKLKEGESESGVFMSCILRPSLFVSQAGFLGAMAAVALTDALEEHSPARFGIGWVSDVYCEGIRIGGAMLEGKLDRYSAFEYLIVTFAVRLNAEHFPPRLTDMIRKVFESENASLPMIIGRTILTRFFALYPNAKTPKKFMDDYSQKFALRGLKIKRRLEDEKFERVKVLGIDSKNGALMVEGKDGNVLHITARGSVILPKKIRIRAKDKQ
jgi:BirA family biotin operon repressor/biotin-[acetyl-CoA-carboxylase] ligase